MFWRKKTFTDPELGTLHYQGGTWYADLEAASGEPCYANVAGDRSGPDPASLQQARTLLADLAVHRQKAAA